MLNDFSKPSICPKKENAWSYTTTPLYIFKVYCLIKHMSSFTFKNQITSYCSCQLFRWLRNSLLLWKAKTHKTPTLNPILNTLEIRSIPSHLMSHRCTDQPNYLTSKHLTCLMYLILYSKLEYLYWFADVLYFNITITERIPSKHRILK